MQSMRATMMFPILAGLTFAGSPLGAQKVERLDSYEGVAIRMLQSNNAGNVHAIIDPALNQVVGYLEGCPGLIISSRILMGSTITARTKKNTRSTSSIRSH